MSYTLSERELIAIRDSLLYQNRFIKGYNPERQRLIMKFEKMIEEKT